MQQYLKKYRMTIQAISPIFVGSGEKIGKKEYIYLPRQHRVIIPDLQKMYQDIEKNRQTRAYEEFIMDSRNNQMPISVWLGQNGFGESDYRHWARYEMDAGEAFQDRNNRPKEIEAFSKDAYGMPYVPGSSLKGMLRTALLVWEILEHPSNYQENIREIRNGSRQEGKRNSFLLKETKHIEQRAFNRLERTEKMENAVNDWLSGIRVGDSEPIKLARLTLSQKVDVTLDGNSKSLPILRETLTPGTQIHFDLTIDSSICPYTITDIMDALETFRNLSNQYFYNRFHRNVKNEGAVFLGGGCGYVSKTVLYALLGEDAVPVIDRVFRATLGKNYTTHKHMRDIGLKIAPHVCKCTMYQNELYDMGIGILNYREA